MEVMCDFCKVHSFIAAPKGIVIVKTHDGLDIVSKTDFICDIRLLRDVKYCPYCGRELKK